VATRWRVLQHFYVLFVGISQLVVFDLMRSKVFVVDIYLRGRHYMFINTIGANAKVQTL
jgi:hypothetical protein